MDANQKEIVIKAIDEDSKIIQYSKKLSELRKDGVTLITEMRGKIAAAKRDKMMDNAEREKVIIDCKATIEKAKASDAKNRQEISRLSKEAVSYVNLQSKSLERQVNETQDKKIAEEKKNLEEKLATLQKNGQVRIKKIVDEYAGKFTKEDQKEKKDELATASYELKSAIYDAKNKSRTIIDRCKADKYQVSVDRVQLNRSLRNGRSKWSEDQMLKWKSSILNFKASTFFLENGLYLAILVFFIVCIVLAPISGAGNLLTLPNIFTILEQSSTRMFYALGVAGLILLAGTDLSVGRMVAMGSVVTGLILHPGKNIVTFFKLGPWDFTSLPMGLRVLMSLFFAIVLCVAFSAFAGFFCARLKMHPFISTLATQLIIYGLLFYGTSGTPVGSIDSSIKDAIGGRWIIGMTARGELLTFPKLIIPAIFAVIVAWFIWNKTTFGKNMYAVGGNGDAASVSGISVFKVTMGVFIMAGIFYGCGSFLEAFRANASAGTGQGFELDAIAACVVGGISFNGGIGKIGGAVIGVIIFTSLTYCLTFLGIDTNLQFVFKGFIIIAAVALDSVKYLKRK